MAAKVKTKEKSMSKAQRSIVKKTLDARKSRDSKKKTAKAAVSKSSAAKAKNGSGSSARVVKVVKKVELRSSSKARQVQPKAAAVQKPIVSREYADAVHTYEAGLRLMHAEEYSKAIKAFRELIAEHTEEPEILERARVLMQASEKKLHEKGKTVFRSAEDHYNVGIAALNRRDLDTASQHLQQALKLAPKADHILYALAVVNALKGNREDALSFLKHSIQVRPENRFLAARDSDFQILDEDSDFKHLVTGA
jgi:tetratricopeptide (TPR) repeat protein